MRRVALVVVVASAFGPYLPIGLGVRTDQVVVYALAALMLPSGLLVTRMSGYASAVATVWMLYLLIAATGVNNALNSSEWGTGATLANLDNLLLPLVTFLLAIVLAEGRDANQVYGDVAWTVTAGTLVSASTGILQYAAPELASRVIPLWLGSGDTAERAASLGRYTGILGQPSVAGAVYTLGLLCAVYAMRDRPIALTLSVIVISTGGLLTVSKAFLLVGLPLGGWLLLRTRHSKKLLIVVTTSAVLAVGVRLGPGGDWSGWARVRRLLPGQGRSSVEVYTGNRYGSDAATQPVIDAALRDHPWFGYGLGGLATPTDTLLVQALVLAGAVGVACVAAVLVLMSLIYWKQRTYLDARARQLFGPLILAIVVLSLGSPALTANRVAVISWTLLAVMFARSLMSGSADRHPARHLVNRADLREPRGDQSSLSRHLRTREKTLSGTPMPPTSSRRR